MKNNKPSLKQIQNQKKLQKTGGKGEEYKAETPSGKKGGSMAQSFQMIDTRKQGGSTQKERPPKEKNVQPVDGEHLDPEVYSEESDKEVRQVNKYEMYALYEPKYDKSYLQLMVHHGENYSKTDYYNFDRFPYQVGDQQFSVFHLTFRQQPEHRNDYQLRFVTPAGTMVTSDRHYFERIHYERPIIEGENQFIFGLKIVRNESHFYDKDPQGNSVVEPLDELLQYSMYFLQASQFDILKDMIKQFQARYTKIPQSQRQTCFRFSSNYEKFALEHMGNMNVIGPLILEIHGLLLPSKMEDIAGFEMSVGIVISMASIQDIANTFEKVEIVTEKQLWEFLKVKGLLLHMLLLQQKHSEAWLEILIQLVSACPVLLRPFFKLLFNNFIGNSYKLKSEICWALQDKIQCHYEETDLMTDKERLDLQLQLLSLPGDLTTFIKLLGITLDFKPKKDENILEMIGDEEVENMITEAIQSKIIEDIDKFTRNLITDIHSVVNFLQQFKQFSVPVQNYFIMSQVRKAIGHIFTLAQTYQPDKIEVLRQVFIDFHDKQLLQNVLFKDVVQKLLDNLNVSFRTVYNKLLRDWNDIQLTKECARRRIFSTFNSSDDIESLIIHADQLQEDIRTFNIEAKDKRKAEEIEEYMSETIVAEISYKVSLRHRVDLLHFISRFTKCKNAKFQNWYIRQTEEKVIIPFMNNAGNFPLQRLLALQYAFQQTGESLQLISILIIKAFNYNEDKPTIEKVRKELVELPSIDHTWYKVIEMYDSFKDQEYCRHIMKTIGQFGIQLIDRYVVIDEIIKIRAQSKAQRTAFCSYLRIAVTAVDAEKLQGKTIEDHVASIIEELQQKLDQISQLKDFLQVFMNLGARSPLMQQFNAVTKDFTTKQIKDLNFEGDLDSYIGIAKKMHFLKYSIIFTRHLDIEKELGVDDGTPETLRDQCERAMNSLQNEIEQFVSKDLSQFRISKIKNLQGMIQLSEEQINKEMMIFSRIVDDEKGKLSILKKLLLALNERSTLHKLCASLIDLSQMKYTYKDMQNGGVEVLDLIFNLDIDEQVDVSFQFTGGCVIGFEQLSAQEYLDIHQLAKSKLLSKMEKIVIQSEFLINTSLQPVGLQRQQSHNNEDSKTPDEETPGREDSTDHKVKKVIQILSQFSEKSESLFQFLRNVKSEELEQLKEYVNDYDEGLVSTQTVLDCIAIWEYVQEIIQEALISPMSFDHLIGFIVSNLSHQKFRGIEQKISSCLIQIVAIKELKNTLESKEEAKKKQIIEIMKGSDFQFQCENERWSIKLSYTKNGKLLEFNSESILELRDRALLIQHTSSGSGIRPDHQSKEDEYKQQEEQEIIGQYVKFSNLIKSVIQNLNLLFQYGYPEDESHFQKQYKCKDQNFDEIQALDFQIETKLSQWKANLVDAYQNNYWLTFIDGRNFWVVEKYLKGVPQREEDAKKAINILKLMRKSDENIQFPEEWSETEDPWQRLMHLGLLLELTPQMDNIFTPNQEEIDPLARIMQKPGEIFFLETNQPFVGIISLYINSGKPFPRADQLFFCNEGTTWQQLQSFLYRSVKSPDQELHTIIKPEQLSLDNQDQVTNLLSRLIKDEMHIEVHAKQFNFGIITTDSRSHVSNYFRFQPYIRTVKDQQILDEQKIKEVVQRIDDSTMFVRSARAGLGKTHFISQKAVKEDKLLIIFPIAGELSYENIGQRLSELKLDEPSILCLQINFVENIQLLNEILVNLALFRVLKTPKTIFILPDYCSICIEFSNTFDNSFEKNIFYRKYVRDHFIEDFNLDEILIKSPDDPLLYVIHNLEMFQSKQIATQEVTTETLLANLPDKDRCIQLLMEYFVTQQRKVKQEPNYIQMNIFLNILKTLFENFHKCYYFSLDNMGETIKDMNANGLTALVEEYKNIRLTVVGAMLMTVNEFTVKSINRDVSRNQIVTNLVVKSEFDEQENEEEKKEEDNQQARVAQIEDQFQMGLTWDSTNHFNVLFVEDGSVMFIYRDPNQVPNDMKKIIYIQANANIDGNTLNSNIQGGNYKIEDLSKFDHKQLLEKLQIFQTHFGAGGYRNQDYVVTTDNFLKMNVIYLRVQSKVPVIIMGETGCGKTSLIRYFCQNIRNEELEIFNIHAGVTSKIILDKMRDYINKAFTILPQKLWVFFDEFNTSENIGLICEILCERSLLGEAIPENMCLLAACNPYRLKSRRLRFDENVGIKRGNNNRRAQNMLLHLVHPLPDNVIEYVWDFGALTENDYQKYIYQMLYNSKVEKGEHVLTGTRDQIKQQELSIKMMVDMLIACHKYFTEHEDSSSVSLRDISRFIILQKWFKDSLEQKKQLMENGGGKSESYLENLEKYKIPVQDYSKTEIFEIIANLLAICHCYYLRISSLHERDFFLEQICTAQNVLPDLNPEYIKGIISMEQNDYLVRMELPEGTAVNQALKENIFAMIPCIINKIPVFICGKPGCSKSLAISLIFSNLRGVKSADNYFKTLPELTMVSFQGSDSCTSDGILQAFERAKKYLTTDAINLIPVFVFDEIGLAELSKHNPLKVLHSLLEVENREIAFVGISNWRLDASKMNRALYLARPDPDEEDLKFTALCIYNSICPGIKAYEILIKDLASSYFDLKSYFKLNFPEYTDFYGLRDFYHLIKQVSKVFKNKVFADEVEKITHVKRAIDRNFGGKINAAAKLGEFFTARNQLEAVYPQIRSDNVLDLISMNLADRQDSRYLMLICRADVATFILERKFRDSIKQRRTVVGSNLENDKSKEQYGFRSLSDIILYVEKGISVILKDMEHIYSSLYDLFNQNFAIFGDKRYCRIALGALLNPKCFVNENFHCIIFMSDNDDILKKADAPFLNRFEKHYLKLDSILSEDEKEVVNILKDWVNSLLRLRMDQMQNLQQLRQQKSLLKATSLFPNYSNDTLGLIVLKNNENGADSIENTVIQCKKEMIKFATQDLIILAHIANISVDEKQFIIETYHEAHEISFFQQLKLYLGQDEQVMPVSNKVIALTFSLGFPTNIVHEELNVRNISNFKSEEELSKNVQAFYESNVEKVFIIEADYSKDKEHINFIKYVVDKIESEALLGLGGSIINQLGKVKTIILLVHMQRNFNEQECSSLPLFEGWEQRVYYDISERPFNITDELELINTNIKAIIQQETLFDFKQILGSLTEKCLLKLNFEQDEQGGGSRDTINENLFFIMEKITSDEKLIQAFKEKIYANIGQEQKALDWKYQVCCNLEVYNNSHNLLEAIKRIIELHIEKYLTSIFYLLEKNTAFKSFFTLYEDADQGEKIRDIWSHVFSSLPIQGLALQTLSQSNYTSFISNLSFPFSRLEHEILKELVIDQKKYESDVDEQVSTPIEYFAEQFNMRSKLGPYVNHLLTDEEIQNLYFKDNLRIFLIENLIKLEFEPFINIILQKIMNQSTDFHKKLHTFMMKQQLFIQICNILNIYCQIKGLKNDDKETLGNIQDLLELCEDESWQVMIGTTLDEIISDCYPDMESTENLQSLEKLAALLEKLFGMLATIGNGIQLKKIQILRFWSDLTNIVIVKSEIEQHFLYQCSNIAQKIDNDEEADEEFLQNLEFVQHIISHFEGKTDECSLKFMCSFFLIIVDQDARHLGLVAENFERNGDQLYKYSSGLFQKIMQKVEIVSQIETYEEIVNGEAQDQEYVDMLLPNNQYLEMIERVLDDLGITSKFGVIISDLILKRYLVDGIQEEMLLQNYRNFKNYMSIAIRTDLTRDSYPNIQKLIANSLIRCYLDVYSLFIYKLQNTEGNENFELNEYEVPVMDDIEEMICTSPLKTTLSIYCFKKLKQMMRVSISKLKQFAEEKLFAQYRWVSECDMGQAEEEKQQQQTVDMVPIIEELADGDRQIQVLIRNIQNTNDLNSKGALKRILEDPDQSIKSRIKIGLAFMKQCYLSYSMQRPENQYFKQFYTEEVEEILDLRFGKEYTSLISLMVSNFQAGNILKMDHTLQQIDIHKRLVSVYVLILVLAFQPYQNQIIGQFYKNGEFSLENTKNSYLCGLEQTIQHQYIQNLHLNFQTLKSDTWQTQYRGGYAVGSTYICGDGCDYVYFVGNCGGQVMQSNCPWCNKIIGGAGHKIHERPGHANLSDEQAIAYLSQLNDRYEHQMPQGYTPVNPPEQNSTLTYNKIQPVTWRLLRLFLHIPLYFMHMKGAATEEQLLDAFSGGKQDDQHPLRQIRGATPKSYLQSHINNDLNMIFIQLSGSGNDSVAPWIYYILEQMIPIFETQNLLPTTSQIRCDFEKLIDREIVAPNMVKVGEIAQLMKERLLKKSNIFDKLVAELELGEEEKQIVLNLELYRQTGQFSYENMRSTFFLNPENSKEFKILKICFDNFDDIQKLKKFYPIIEFTSALLPRFNHLMTREDARMTKIKTLFTDGEEGKILREMYKRFMTSWNTIAFEKKIQYGCKQLDYMKYDEESETINFLVDNKEPGNGMCMAAGLCELTDIQNKVFNDLAKAYSSDRNLPIDFVVDTFSYSVQRVKEPHILKIDIDDIITIKNCSLNNIKYGSGEELVYDFARIQANITKDVLTRKFLRADNLEFIQYQLELITINGEKSALITEIRKKYPQTQFDKEMQKKVNDFFDTLAKRSEKENQESLKQLHGGLEKLLCFLLNAKEFGETKLEDFCKKVRGRIDPRFIDKSILSQVRLDTIISLYELIEKKNFPFIYNSIRQDFLKTDNEAYIEEKFKVILDESDKKASNLPTRQQIENSLMRFVIRCLAADLKPEHPLVYYFMREDFWEEGIEEIRLTTFEEVIPADINLDHTYCTYTVIKRLNGIAESKLAQAPAANRRLPAPAAKGPAAGRGGPPARDAKKDKRQQEDNHNM